MATPASHSSVSEKTHTDIAVPGTRAPMSGDFERGYALGRDSNVELLRLRSPSASSRLNLQVADHHHEHEHEYTGSSPVTQYARELYDSAVSRERVFWDRLRGKGKRKVGWGESLKNALMSSWLNILLLAIPLAWVAHFLQDTEHSWGHNTVFSLCFTAIIPLEALFDWGGEQMAIYLGKTIGDLLIVTLNNAVETALAIILLAHCELRLLQSTIVGVVILHLLLVPGVAFLAGGARVWEQTLHPHHTQLNHSLLTIGILSILLPTAFFAALDRGPVSIAASGNANFEGSTLITDKTRQNVLAMSRGFAIILKIVYVASRVYLSNPPGEDNALKHMSALPEELKEAEDELNEIEPAINPLACFLMLCLTVGLTGATAEWLVESIEHVREEGHIQEEWFGLILLPVVSFAADGMVALVYFFKSALLHILGKKAMVPSLLARARAIDLSIQFTLWWMPFLVLLGWILDNPMILLFDFYELSLLLGSCFLVNYITADSKTNWVEGLILVAFYIMIAVSAWFYVGQPELQIMLSCPDSVASAIVAEVAGGGGE
ncbi:hypothetical protein EUX98_g5342 [Antrodiella citrinella]|uniref:Sodium/calcium exchanger membrane region domain-containing protein n=1 Tax=Antrodiella citrinella TaxID=2447956 RepID=A0A4S4MUI4_9APHY|nr:hypothetical protein EUX98_g5342 [Antrodiella citrinella]